MPLKFAAFNQGIAPTITFINKATVPLGVDFDALIAVLQKFVSMKGGFASVWGTPATLVKADEPQPNTWTMLFVDNADAANALGYHDLSHDGYPISKVFVKTTLAAGQKVSVTACHELFEMLVDPAINLWAVTSRGVFWAYEMSDAVEDETFELDGIAMSDFVYPAFFEGFRAPHSVKFDYLGKVTRPFELLHNGYSIIHRGGRDTQIMSMIAPVVVTKSDNPDLMLAFGSEAKAEKFAMEDRQMHRSEYRQA